MGSFHRQLGKCLPIKSESPPHYNYHNLIMYTAPVVSGNFGISLYEKTSSSLSSSRSSARPPSPDPHTIPTSGQIFVLLIKGACPKSLWKINAIMTLTFYPLPPLLNLTAFPATSACTVVSAILYLLYDG